MRVGNPNVSSMEQRGHQKNKSSTNWELLEFLCARIEENQKNEASLTKKIKSNNNSLSLNNNNDIMNKYNNNNNKSSNNNNNNNRYKNTNNNKGILSTKKKSKRKHNNKTRKKKRQFKTKTKQKNSNINHKNNGNNIRNGNNVRNGNNINNNNLLGTRKDGIKLNVSMDMKTYTKTLNDTDNAFKKKKALYSRAVRHSIKLLHQNHLQIMEQLNKNKTNNNNNNMDGLFDDEESIDSLEELNRFSKPLDSGLIGNNGNIGNNNNNQRKISPIGLSKSTTTYASDVDNERNGLMVKNQNYMNRNDIASVQASPVSNPVDHLVKLVKRVTRKYQQNKVPTNNISQKRESMIRRIYNKYENTYGFEPQRADHLKNFARNYGVVITFVEAKKFIDKINKINNITAKENENEQKQALLKYVWL